ncbi:formylglycine-generating enzyme family protein [Streptomyces sp. NPDC048257]|uniref:formylglycine-generating enzyme family protein n=1 Tax=Streptomyces sp. NPDC048257 TaxID=3365526 RepID=UPI00370FF5B9
MTTHEGKLSERLIAAIRGDSALASAARVPYLLHLLVVSTERNHEVPTSVGHFCRLASEEFLHKRPRRRAAAAAEPCLLRPGYDTEIQRIIEEVGFSITSLRSVHADTNSISAAAMQEPILRALGEDLEFLTTYPAVVDYVQFIRKGHGILAVDTATQLSFRENLFRDYFAGCALARRDSETIVGLCRHPIWHAPLRYWASAQTTPEGHRLVTGTAAELAGAAEEAGDGGLPLWLLAGELLVILAAARPDAEPYGLVRRLRRSVSEAVATARGDRGQDLETRARAATVEAQLNPSTWEERSGSFLADSWVIPAGEYPIGSAIPLNSQDDKYRHIDWFPQRTESIGSFRISTLPVTNRDYAQFVASGGYQDLDCWPDGPARLWVRHDPSFIDAPDGPRAGSTDTQRIHLSKEMREGIVDEESLQEYVDQLLLRRVPLYWWDPRYNQPTQPVVGVNWWEALAYCRWLTKRLRERNVLDDNSYADIPTEAEWECSCPGRLTSDPYPWGSEWQEGMAHVRTAEGWTQRSVPVGLFPWAGGEGGAQDMIGNVWEWTRSLAWSYDDPRPGREALDTQGDRIVRGGSWFSREQGARMVQFRSYDPPQNAYVDLGFRVAFYTG